MAPHAFVAALEAHRGLLFGVCYRMLGNQADAEDLVQDTMERALRKPPADLERDPRGWLIRVAMNACRDHLRAHGRRREGAPWLPSALLTPIESVEAARDPEARYGQLESVSVAFLCAVQELSATQRAVLLLRDVFDFSVRETADALELSESNVKTTLHRARATMQAYDERREPPSRQQAYAAQQILKALFFHVETGNQTALRALLADGVVVLNDTDDELFAARRPVVGIDKAVLFLLKTLRIHRKHAQGLQRVAIRQVNGQPAVVALAPSLNPRIPQRIVCWVDVDRRGRVTRIVSQLNPEKLPTELFADLPAVTLRMLLDGLRAATAAPPLFRWLPGALRSGARRARTLLSRADIT